MNIPVFPEGTALFMLEWARTQDEGYELCGSFKPAGMGEEVAAESGALLSNGIGRRGKKMLPKFGMVKSIKRFTEVDAPSQILLDFFAVRGNELGVNTMRSLHLIGDPPAQKFDFNEKF